MAFRIAGCLLGIISSTLFAANAALAISDSAPHKLVIMHTNDTHGHPLAFDDYPGKGVGGLPARKTLVNKVRSESENFLLLDAGDLNTGCPESTFFKAEADILGYNDIGYDAMAIGNHEFDNSNDVLRSQMQLASFKFLSANAKYLNGEYVGTPYLVKQMNGIKVGILGITAQDTGFLGTPDNVKNIVFEDEVETAKKVVTILRDLEKVDVVIALVHLGIFDNSNTGSLRLAEQVSGINLIIDGHSHTKLAEPLVVNGTPIVQAFNWGEVVGKAEFTVASGQITDFKWQGISVNMQEKVKNPDGTDTVRYIGEKIDEDQELLAKLKVYADKVNSVLSEVVGTAEDGFTDLDLRTKEMPLGHLVADSIKSAMQQYNPDFALLNSGSIRTQLPPGEITKKTIYSILPFDNTLVIASLKGKDINDICTYISTTKGKGAFPALSNGVEMHIDFVNGKCLQVKVNGNLVNEEQIYKIVTNNYLASGGDNYVVFKNKVGYYDSSMFQRDAFVDYVKALGTVKYSVLVPRIFEE